MKHSEALEHLEFLLRLTQKTRSNILESMARADGRDENCPIDLAVAQNIFPWLFGAKDITIPMNLLLSRIHSGEKRLEPMEFYNFMFIVDRTEVLREGASLWGHVLPKPHPVLMYEWEPE